MDPVPRAGTAGAATIGRTLGADAPTVRPCPSCDADNSNGPLHAHSWRHWKLRRCANCGFVYVENPPRYGELAADQAWEANRGDRRARMRSEFPLAERFSQARRTVHRRLGRLTRGSDRLNRWIVRWVPPGRVVDVGCGDGDRLAALPTGYTGVGIEISCEIARTAEANLAGCGMRVVNAPAIDGLASLDEGSATGVLMRSFLEHEIRPRELLAEVARVLRHGGAAVVKVPNHASLNRRVMGPRWCGYRFPGHVNHFTPRALARMVEDAGLTVARFGPLDRFPLSDSMWLAARRDQNRSTVRAPTRRTRALTTEEHDR